MTKKFTKLIAAIALLVFMMPSLAGWGQTTVASFSRSNTTDTYTEGQTFTFAAEGKTGFYQDGSGTAGTTQKYLQLKGSTAYWTTTPESISFTAKLGGGSAQDPLTYNVLVALLDNDGNEISGTSTIVTTKITNNTGSNFTVSIPAVNNVYGVKLSHIKESGYNVRYYSFSLSYVAGSSSSVATPQLSKGTSYCDEEQSITITCDTEDATIYYTLDGSEPTSSSTPYSGAISITETKTLRAIAVKDEESSAEASATYTFVTTLKTMEAIYAAATAAGSTATTVYIHFNNYVISAINSGSSTVAYLTDGTNGCYIYGSGHGFVAGKVLNGIAACNLKQYYNMAYISGLTASSSGLEVTDGGTVTPVVTTINDLGGINAGSVVTLNGLTWDGTNFSDGTNTIKNSTAVYTATSLLTNGKIYDITGVFDYDYSGKRINPRSAADVVIGPATLPFEWAGGGKNALMAVQGVTANGLGSDYADANAPYLVKFDDNGDYILVRTDSQPDVVTIGVKKFASGNTTIKVQGSVDGETFSDVETLTFDVSQNNTQTLSTENSFNANVRYVRIIRNSGANVGVGPISITKFSTDPVITVSPSSITDFSYTVGGGPSEVKSFTVGGGNLGTTAISIALGENSDFELSFDENAATWQNSLTTDAPTDGTVANTTVYVRMKANLEEGSHFGRISVTWGNLSESISLSGIVNPAPVTYTYTAASSITPGKHYIIVGFADSDWDQPYAMAEQKANNRNAISVADYYDVLNDDSDEFSIPSNAGVAEFVISGDEVNKYSIYAVADNGYLYTVNDNRLYTQATLVDGGKWTIAQDDDDDNYDDMVISVGIVSGDNIITRIMRFNSSSKLFACYTGGQKDIYLYERTDNDCHIYSATNISSNTTVSGDMNIHAGVVTVASGATLSVEGFLDNENPANLIIEDGGQLYTNDVVEATIKKNISKYTIAANDDSDPDNVALSNGWYLISYPLNCDYTQGGDDPTGVTNLITTSTYDLYLFDPAANQYNQENGEEWVNYKAHSSDFKLITSHGYLYSNAADVTLEFAGSVNYTDPEGPGISLENGYNLVGNPYTYNAYPSVSYYKMNNDGTAITADLCDDAIEPCTGIIVDNNNGSITDITFSKNQPEASAFNGSVQMTLAQTVTTRGESNTKTLDNAILSFNEGSQLGKFYFGTQNANLYIPQGNKEYAIVSSEAQGEMPVNFRANANGQYTLTVNPENVEMNYLHLIDNMTGADVDLLQEPTYTFIAKTTDYESRFRLVFASSANGNENDSESFAFLSNGQLIIANEGQATLQVIDITGRILSSETINGSCSKSLNAPAGVYMLRLVNGDNVKVQKMVVR